MLVPQTYLAFQYNGPQNRSTITVTPNADSQKTGIIDRPADCEDLVCDALWEGQEVTYVPQVSERGVRFALAVDAVN